VNVNIHVPAQFLERLTSAVERLATAAERIAGPVLQPPDPPKPYPPEMWETTTNAQRIEIEEEERREAVVSGHLSWEDIEQHAHPSIDSTNPPAR
jgi:hypothetical protein